MCPRTESPLKNGDTAMATNHAGEEFDRERGDNDCCGEQDPDAWMVEMNNKITTTGFWCAVVVGILVVALFTYAFIMD